MKKIIVLMSCLLWSATAFAADITIDTTMTDQEIITAIESVQAGDTVLIQPGTYQVRLYIQNHGTAQNPIIIKGADPNNRPIFDYTGKDVELWPGTAEGWFSRYAIVNQGNYVVMQDLVVKGARQSGGTASAGIYNGPKGTITEPAALGTQPLNFILRNVEITDCDDGFNSTGINTLVENCHLHGNGYPERLTSRHNANIHGGSITFKDTVFENALSGQHIFNRAQFMTIESCTFGKVGAFPFLMGTPKADMTDGVEFAQRMIIRNSHISAVRLNGSAVSKMIGVNNVTNYVGLKQYLRLHNNTFVGAPGSRGDVVALYRATGTAAMGVTSSGNSYENYNKFLALSPPGEDINDSFYRIQVRDVAGFEYNYPIVAIPFLLLE